MKVWPLKLYIFILLLNRVKFFSITMCTNSCIIEVWLQTRVTLFILGNPEP